LFDVYYELPNILHNSSLGSMIDDEIGKINFDTEGHPKKE